MDKIRLLLEGGLPRPNSAPIDQAYLSELSRGSLRQYLHGQYDTPSLVEVDLLWQYLFASTFTRDASEKYLTAACNCISVFLVSAASSPLADVKDFPASGEDVWEHAFLCALKAFEGGKTKPALQVLETLAQLLRECPDKNAASERLHDSSQELLRSLFTGHPSLPIKAACIAITCLLKKTNLFAQLEDTLAETLNQVSCSWKEHQLHNGVSVGDHLDQQSCSRHLFLALLFAVRNLETRSAALKLFTLLLQADNWTRDSSPTQSAADVIELFIKQVTDSIGDFADNIMSVILDDKARFQTFVDIYRPENACSESKLILYLYVLKAGRLKRFLSEAGILSYCLTIFSALISTPDLASKVDETVFPPTNHAQNNKDPYRSFRHLLKSSSATVRIHAYSLLTANFGTTAVIPRDVLQCLIDSVDCLYDDNDAYERGEVVSITRRLLRRLESSRGSLQKMQPSSAIAGQNTLNNYDSFLHRFSRFLLKELDPGISYPRHILALQTFQLLLRTVPEVWVDLAPLVASLSSLSLDPFDDVRSTASTLLREVVELDSEGVTQYLVSKLLEDTGNLSARTCRHDHADAAGRLWPVVKLQGHNSGPVHATLHASLLRLEEHLKAIETMSPGSDYPLHAMLLGFAYTLGAGLDQSRSMCAGLLTICRKIWVKVLPHLCVDSPETETDDAEGGGNSGPKDLLAYSWRALRDSRYGSTARHSDTG